MLFVYSSLHTGRGKIKEDRRKGSDTGTEKQEKRTIILLYGEREGGDRQRETERETRTERRSETERERQRKRHTERQRD